MLGERIAALRRRAGFSQAELAQRLQISASAMGMYEQGRREPAAQMLAALSDTFGVSIDYLVTGKPDTRQDREAVSDTVCHCVDAVEKRLQSRREQPFTRQELALLFASLLTEP